MIATRLKKKGKDAIFAVRSRRQMRRKISNEREAYGMDRIRENRIRLSHKTVLPPRLFVPALLALAQYFFFQDVLQLKTGPRWDNTAKAEHISCFCSTRKGPFQ